MWIKDQNEIEKLFTKWRGSAGQVWEYVCGHGTLLVRFYRPNERSSLYVQCKECRTIKFHSTGWKDSSLELHEKQNPEQNDEDYKFEIKDGERFYVACWGVYLAESEIPFHIDWPPESTRDSCKWKIL